MNIDCTNIPRTVDSTRRTLKETDIVLSATLNRTRRDIGSFQAETTDALRRLDCGETDSLHRVLIAAEIARASYELLIDMHRRAIGTYREIIRNTDSN